MRLHHYLIPFKIRSANKFFILYFFAVIQLLYSCEKENTSTSECNDSVLINNSHKVEGYTNKNSYLPGETIQFKIHSLSSHVNINIYHYGANTTLIHTKDSVISKKQNYNCRSYSFGCNWQTTYNYVVPPGLTSGIYSAHITNDLNESCYISFVIKNTTNSNSEILVLASTNTWQAYNNWSNQSFYQYSLSEETHNSTIVSFHRPNLQDHPTGNTGHLVAAELHLHRWLENNNYPFDVVADKDLHENSSLLNNYKVLILNVHPEYWTLEMYNHLVHFLNNGGKLMYLGGNGIYWRVALKYDRIEVRKSGDPHKYTSGTGGKFRDLGMPESRHLGVQYTNAGIHTYAPYKVYHSNHWIYNNTGVVDGQLIGQNSLNNGKASGSETDETSIHSPYLTVLGIGTNAQNGGAHLIYYHKTNGSKVFSVGSITYTGSLSVDPIIDQITKNVLNDFLQ